MENADSGDQFSVWQNKYERLLESYTCAQRNNQELEERLLQIIEKAEADKVVLSDEIDCLNDRLQNAMQKVAHCEETCAKYKSDCLLAVHLLQCQPSFYITQQLSTLPDSVKENLPYGSLPKVASASALDKRLSLNKDASILNKNPEPAPSVNNCIASFPPTAMIFQENFGPPARTVSEPPITDTFGRKEEQLIEFDADHNSIGGYDELSPPMKRQDDRPSRMKLGPSNGTSGVVVGPEKKDADNDMGQMFASHIMSSPEYVSSCRFIRKCGNCGHVVTDVDRATQTEATNSEALCRADNVMPQVPASNDNVSLSSGVIRNDSRSIHILQSSNDAEAGKSADYDNRVAGSAASAVSHDLIELESVVDELPTKLTSKMNGFDGGARPALHRKSERSASEDE